MRILLFSIIFNETIVVAYLMKNDKFEIWWANKAYVIRNMISIWVDFYWIMSVFGIVLANVELLTSDLLWILNG